MGGFNFRNREDLLRVLDQPDQPPKQKRKLRQGVQNLPPATPGWIFLTPSGGIAQRSGLVCQSEDCTPYYIAEDGTLTELTDDSGSSQTVEVWHFGFDYDIPGSIYIQCKEVFGKLVADAGDRC